MAQIINWGLQKWGEKVIQEIQANNLDARIMN